METVGGEPKGQKVGTSTLKPRLELKYGENCGSLCGCGVPEWDGGAEGKEYVD